MADRLEITPRTRIGELLKAHPELEELLVTYAPAFKKLRNPILRRTVARVATVEQAASIAGIDVREMVAALRRAAGYGETGSGGAIPARPENEKGRWPRPPGWVDASTVEAFIDADALLEANEVPVTRVARAARGLGRGGVIRVASTFRPVPLMEALERQGFRVFLRRTGADRFETFVCRAGRAPTSAGEPPA